MRIRAHGDVTITTTNMVGTSHEPATLEVYDDNGPVIRMAAVIDHQKGADGGMYPCVVFRRIPFEED